MGARAREKMVELDSEGYKCTKTVKKEDVARMERMLERGKTCNLAGSRVVRGTNLESTTVYTPVVQKNSEKDRKSSKIIDLGRSIMISSATPGMYPTFFIFRSDIAHRWPMLPLQRTRAGAAARTIQPCASLLSFPFSCTSARTLTAYGAQTTTVPWAGT